MPSVTLSEVGPPVSIEQIFNMDCFKFGNMQKLFVNIYEYLQVMGENINDMKIRMDGIPDFSELEKKVAQHSDQIKIIDKQFRD